MSRENFIRFFGYRSTAQIFAVGVPLLALNCGVKVLSKPVGAAIAAFAMVAAIAAKMGYAGEETKDQMKALAARAGVLTRTGVEVAASSGTGGLLAAAAFTAGAAAAIEGNGLPILVATGVVLGTISACIVEEDRADQLEASLSAGIATGTLAGASAMMNGGDLTSVVSLFAIPAVVARILPAAILE